MNCTPGMIDQIVFPGDPEYDTARMDFNTRFSKFPCAIIFCRRPQDAANAISQARELGVPLRIRSGRHSYEAFSLVDDGIVIDVSSMTDIGIDKQRDLAVIGAGVDLLTLYEKLWQNGVTIPGGTCPSVGIAGLILGGGFGMLSRLMGLACDSLVGLDMVCANGETIYADKYHNSDLLWAARGGGGGNFGVVTAFHCKVHPISDVTVFDITWNWNDITTVIGRWQEWAPDTDIRLTPVLQTHSCQEGSLTATGLFVGSSKELCSLLKPLISAGRPVRTEIQSIPYIEAVYKFAGTSVPHKFKNTGAYAYDSLPPEALKILASYLASAPSKDNLIEFQSLWGAVSRVSPTATAYFHRPAKFNLQYIAQWENDTEEKANIKWVNALRQAMLPYVTGTYVNFPDCSICDWPEAYYGANFNRLKRIKQKYDPLNIFHFPQSIPPIKKSGF